MRVQGWGIAAVSCGLLISSCGVDENEQPTNSTQTVRSALAKSSDRANPPAEPQVCKANCNNGGGCGCGCGGSIGTGRYDTDGAPLRFSDSDELDAKRAACLHETNDPLALERCMARPPSK